MQIKRKIGKSQFVYLLGFYFVSLILGAVNIGSIGSALKILGLLPVAFWLLNGRKLRPNSLYYGVLFHTAWAFLSIVWSTVPDNSVSNFITLISFCLMLMATSSYDYNQTEIDWLKSMLIWSSRITVVAALFGGKYNEGRLYFSGIISEDPNYLCGYFLFGVADCVAVLFQTQRGQHKLLRLLELAVYMYTVLATGSRGGAIAVAGTVLSAIFMVVIRQKHNLRVFISRIATVLVLVLAFIFVTNYVSSDLLSRFSVENVTESNAAGRFDIWSDTINTYVNAEIGRQIGGFGGATSLEVSKQMNFYRTGVSHNAFLSNLIELGGVGILLYLIYLFVFVRYSFKQKDTFSLAIMVGMIALAMSTSITSFKPFWNIMLYICCFSKSVLASKEPVNLCATKRTMRSFRGAGVLC